MLRRGLHIAAPSRPLFDLFKWYLIMNIFILDQSRHMSARYLHNKHLPKMILESAQLIASAVHYAGLTHPTLYKPTHMNHPCAKWTRESASNLRWLVLYTHTMNREFMSRFNHTTPHKSRHALSQWPIDELLSILPDDTGLTPFPQCVPDQYKQPDPVQAYRAYYRAEKCKGQSWGNAGTPEWVLNA